MQEKLEEVNPVEWSDARSALLDWYRTHQRPLPWRESPNPYHTWLCEIIMQQTRIDQGIAYWQRFISTWPDVVALAKSPLEEVLKAWQGLGYYSRARNLHKAAQILAFDRQGHFPETAEEWQKIPGVGPYTAAAIASICFQEPVPAVDGNVLRVISRFRDVREPIDRPSGRKSIEAFSRQWIHPTAPGIHNQAVMEIGATVCKPTSPRCSECPLSDQCLNVQPESGGTPLVPIKQGKTKVKQVNLHFHVVTNGTHVWMRQRPATGIWGGLWEFPSEEVNALTSSPVLPHAAQAMQAPDTVFMWEEPFEHILSHRKMRCQFIVWHTTAAFAPSEGQWLTWKSAESKPRPRAIDRFWRRLEKSCSELARR